MHAQFVFEMYIFIAANALTCTVYVLCYTYILLVHSSHIAVHMHIEVHMHCTHVVPCVTCTCTCSGSVIVLYGYVCTACSVCYQ